MSNVQAYLLYEAIEAVLPCLVEGFGGVEQAGERVVDGEGKIRHTAVRFGDGEVLLGSPGGDYRAPRATGVRTAMVHVFVADVDAHFARAAAFGGAEVVDPVAEASYGRRYSVRDPEGQTWWFAERAAPGASGGRGAGEG
mmetsp:Transcript_13086/g.44279  ORF Transcript_13086/g.44279 Transcript_13086/m.44279 type:complete len:140 (-) Transcript_13086:263-682(-)